MSTSTVHNHAQFKFSRSKISDDFRAHPACRQFGKFLQQPLQHLSKELKKFRLIKDNFYAVK